MIGKAPIRAGLRAVFASALLVGALALPSQALAEETCSNATTDPTANQYCSVGGVDEGGEAGKNKANDNGGESVPASVETSSGTAGVESSGSSLPFTGLDVAILLMVAALLTGTGLALRRLTGAPRS